MKEKDIETAFIAWFGHHRNGENMKYLGRQVVMDIGVLDILYWSDLGPVVVEVKLGKAPSSTCAQLLGYMSYVKSMIEKYYYRGTGEPFGIIVSETIETYSERIISTNDHILHVSYRIQDNEVTFDEDFLHRCIEKRYQGRYSVRMAYGVFGDLQKMLLGELESAIQTDACEFEWNMDYPKGDKIYKPKSGEQFTSIYNSRELEAE